jgi:bifunctional non-homologous end joining protein LigD
VEPTLVAQVAFGSRTRDGILRHASFQGLREDKSPAEVTREKVLPVAKAALRERKTPKRLRQAEAVQPSASQAAGAEYDESQKTFAGVRFTSPDKILYPDQGITKLELANYYRMIADWILPYIADRPVVLVRCPDGCEKECFFQKHPAAGTPDTLRQIPIREKTKTEHYVVVDDVAGLISLAQIGALEIHAWGSRADKLDQPDRLIFDLDPDPLVPWSFVVQSARKIRAFLQELGLESFVKTTGAKGLHLVVPVDRRHDWDEAKAFCLQVAELIVKADPKHFTVNMAKAARHRKIFIDYLRNGRGATAVIPYSTRARTGAPVSTPLSWQELSNRIHADHFSLRSLPERLA